MIPQFPFGQHLGWLAAFTVAESIREPIEEWIEVVILHHEYLSWRIPGLVLAVVLLNLCGHLQTSGRFASPFFTKNDRCGRIRGIAKDFIPARMKGAIAASISKDQIGLGIFVRKWIAGDVMVGKKVLQFHGDMRGLEGDFYLLIVQRYIARLFRLVVVVIARRSRPASISLESV